MSLPDSSLPSFLLHDKSKEEQSTSNNRADKIKEITEENPPALPEISSQENETEEVLEQWNVVPKIKVALSSTLDDDAATESEDSELEEEEKECENQQPQTNQLPHPQDKDASSTRVPLSIRGPALTYLPKKFVPKAERKQMKTEALGLVKHLGKKEHKKEIKKEQARHVKNNRNHLKANNYRNVNGIPPGVANEENFECVCDFDLACVFRTYACDYANCNK